MAGMSADRVFSCRRDPRWWPWHWAVAAVLSSAPACAPATPEIQTWQTGNGVRVLFVEAHEIPILDLQLIFAGGSAADTPGREGLSMLAGSLLDEGAAGRHANDIAFEFERLGAIYGADVSSDSSTVYLRSLSAPDKLGPALENLRRVVLQPDFPDDAIERQRRRLLIGIQQKKQSPAALAEDAFKSAVFGDHPYSRPDEGTETSVGAVTRADLLAWHRQRHVIGNALLVMVGDKNGSAAVQLSEDLLAGLPPGPAVAPVQAVPPMPGPVQQRIEFPSSQTHIIMGQPGMRYGDPDYFSLLVGNHVLGGGGFVTRLFREIREREGLSYSASSYFSPRREAGPFSASVQTESAQSGRALALLQETIARFVSEGPSEEELRAAQRNLAGGFPLRIDSNRKILGYLGVIGFHDLPLDYLDRYIERVNAVTAADIRDAFSRRIDAARMATILVGPAPVEPQGTAP
jgi:zinc protease